MDITSPAASVSTIPRHTADLRPAADAAALARDPRPALPLGPAPASQPPQPGQVAAISRALLDSSEFPPPKQPERVLKPWGVQMLPHREEDRPGRPPATPKDEVADAQGAPDASGASEAATTSARAVPPAQDTGSEAA